MPDAPDGGVCDQNHGGPGHDTERKGYMPVNSPKGDIHDRFMEVDRRVHEENGDSSVMDQDGY